MNCLKHHVNVFAEHFTKYANVSTNKNGGCVSPKYKTKFMVLLLFQPTISNNKGKEHQALNQKQETSFESDCLYNSNLEFTR